MMPVHRHMDSYPHQRNQTGYRAFPAYTQVDPTKSPMVYEPWPYNGSYGYPAPFHSCCSHGNFPGFHAYRPSYPQPMPSPLHCYGGYPTPYREACPVSYVPPPHCSMEMPRYDKNTPWSYHCCVCPHHPGHQKGDMGLKIEEQEPDVVEKKGNYSFVPAPMKQYPYPVVWIPQERLREQRKPPDEAKVVEHESVPRKTKPVERKNSQEQEQNIWNGWFPLDADRLRHLMTVGDEKRTRDQKNEEQKKPVIWMPYESEAEDQGGHKDKKDVIANQEQKSEDQMRQFPFPIFWMPSHDRKQEEVGGKDSKEASGSPKFVENRPFTFKFVPVRQIGGDNGTNSKFSKENLASRNGTEVGDNSATQKVGDNSATQKIIPVKQIDQPCKEVKKSEDNEKKRLTSKPSGTNGKRQSPPPPESPKLPPVCLRVDPLPRKKNGNGSSRSPSPPSAKERSAKNSNEMKVSQDSKLHESTPSESKKVEPKEIMVIQKTVDRSNVEHQSDWVPVHSPTQPNADVTEKPNSEKPSNDGDECHLMKAAAAREAGTTTDEMEERNKAKEPEKSGDVRKLEKKTLSDVEAAVRIQSAYRGFNIRRSEHLKKLKQIAEVREQMADVRNHVQALESTSDAQKDEKQKAVIGETIMRLLLKLDTIQGLLPSLRDIRKSLAKELVTLQEKLDSFAIQKSEEPKSETCPVEPVEEFVSKVENDESELNKEELEETGGSGSSDDISKSSHRVVESAEDQLLQSVESLDRFKGEETLPFASDNTVLPLLSEVENQLSMAMEPEEPDTEAIMEHKDEVRDRVVPMEPKEPDSEAITEHKDGARDRVVPVKPKEPDSEAITEHKDEVRDRVVPEDCKVELMETQEVNNVPVHKQADEVPLKEEKNDSNKQVSSVEAVDAKYVDNNKENTLDALEVIDDEHVESEKDEQLEVEDKAEELMETQKDFKMNELAELPLGAINDDPSSSTEMESNGDHPGKVNEFQSTTEMTSFEDNTPIEVQKPDEVLEEKPIDETKESVEDRSEENKEPLQPLISLGEERTQNVLNEDDYVSAETAAPKEMTSEKNKEDDKDLTLAITDECIKETREMKVETGDHAECVTDEKKNDVSYELEISNYQVSADLHAQEGAEMVGSQNDKQLIEENEKLREMMEKLIEVGKQQLNVISSLNGRVKDLEKKLSKRRKLRTRQNRASPHGCGSSRVKC
ncbi:IQ motif, EF-hand binding site [Parasponia andersonii]|uniref:IQ motif, EF-hand binding site n=1 Tax=Parasponia andersonii TaxID=3476 RepID=A0A2P5BLF1_PARAD|nr:IQ motif, EF-hand binding site [Parasponia andersonii]